MIDLYLWDGYGPDGTMQAQSRTGLTGSKLAGESALRSNDEDE